MFLTHHNGIESDKKWPLCGHHHTLKGYACVPTQTGMEEFFHRLRWRLFREYLYCVIYVPHHHLRGQNEKSPVMAHRIDTKFDMALDWEN